MRPLPVEEEEVEEEDLNEESGEREEMEKSPEKSQQREEADGTRIQSLDPLLLLRDVGLFRDNCTVVFETVTSLDVAAPPNRSQPKSMPNVRQHIRLRSHLQRRHRARWEAEHNAS